MIRANPALSDNGVEGFLQLTIGVESFPSIEM
jgi:hypothetical protein